MPRALPPGLRRVRDPRGAGAPARRTRRHSRSAEPRAPAIGAHRTHRPGLPEVDDGAVALVVIEPTLPTTWTAPQQTGSRRRHRPVSGRSGCGSGWLIENRRKPSNSSEERASLNYWELLE